MDDRDPLEPTADAAEHLDGLPWEAEDPAAAEPVDLAGGELVDGPGVESFEAGASAGLALDSAGVLPAPEWIAALDGLDVPVAERVGGLEARTWAVAAQEAGAEAYVELAGLDELGQALRAGDAVAVAWGGHVLPLVSVEGGEVVLGEGPQRQVWPRAQFEPTWEAAGGELVHLAANPASGRTGSLAVVALGPGAGPLGPQVAGSGDVSDPDPHR